MNRILDAVKAALLVSLAINGPVYADSEVTTLRELDTALWASAQQFCPESADLVLQVSPKVTKLGSTAFGAAAFAAEATATIIAGEDADELPDMEFDADELLDMEFHDAPFPFSPEDIQLGLYVFMAASEVGAVLALESEYQMYFVNPEHPFGDRRQAVRAYADILDCLKPVATRLASSDDPEIAELAQRVIVGVCENRLEYTNRLIALDMSEFTSETYALSLQHLHDELC